MFRLFDTFCSKWPMFPKGHSVNRPLRSLSGSFKAEPAVLSRKWPKWNADSCNIKTVCIETAATLYKMFALCRLQRFYSRISKIAQRLHIYEKLKDCSLTVVKIYNGNANIWIVTLIWTLIRLSVFLTSAKEILNYSALLRLTVTLSEVLLIDETWIHV